MVSFDPYTPRRAPARWHGGDDLVTRLNSMTRSPLMLAAVVVTSGMLLGGCGGGGGATNTTGATSETARSAALSLQQAMNRAAQTIDGIRKTRTSVQNAGTSLENARAQTGDVVVLLTPKASSTGIESALLTAARQQRSFLQFAIDSTDAQTRRAANSALRRAEAAGARASATYERIASENNGLAGLVPSATAFNSGRLRDAVRASLTSSSGSSGSGGSSGGSTGGGGSSGGGSSSAASISCGDGLSVNNHTSCPFARAVRDAYESSGGEATVVAYSPVTNQAYTMTCTSGIPTVCRGGNDAVVAIR